jgi:two-component system phosphate regulon response regulator PhoB
MSSSAPNQHTDPHGRPVNGSGKVVIDLAEADKTERKPPKVLVIDDDDIPRTAMRELLEGAGIEALELSSPIGATQVALNQNVDVVVLDVMMPNLRGDMLAKLFRRNPRLRNLGVILVSGCPPQELAALASECQADAVVSKRDVRTDLVATVWRVQALCRVRAQAPEAERPPRSAGKAGSVT